MLLSPSTWRTYLRHFDPGYWVAALLPLIGLIPSFGEGVIKTADGPLHVQRMYAMMTLLQHGDLWPRWVPYFHLGYGYPIFNFYPPGTFYLGGLLGGLGVAVPTAFNLVAALAWISGSVGMYGLARKILPGTGAILAAMLWSYAPSRLYEVWDQGSLPQMMAAACVPWIIWGLIRASRQPSPRAAVSIAIPFAALILSHQPITIIAGLFIAPISLLLPLVNSQRHWKAFLRRLLASWGGLLLGIGLAMIFLLPVLVELRYVRASAEATDVIAYLRSNFLQLNEIFAQPPAMDLTDLRFELPTTFGPIAGILGALGLLALALKKRWLILLGLLAAVAFGLFMMVEISLSVWQAIPLMTQLRFPERFLRVAIVFLALAGGASLLLLPRRWSGAALGIALAAVLISGLPMVYPNQRFVNWPDLSPLDEIEMEKRDHIWGSTSYDEFNPIWGRKPGWDTNMETEAYRDDPLLIIANIKDAFRFRQDLRVQQLDSAAYNVWVSDERVVRFRQFYFPGWAAWLDGKPTTIYPDSEAGEISINIPAGNHHVRLEYVGTPVQHTAAIITLVSLAITAALIFIKKRSNQLPETSTSERLNPRTAALAAGGVITFALLNSLFITPHTLWFRQRSAPDSPVYMQQEVRQSFGETFELLGYTLDQTSTAPGRLFNVTLFWKAEREITQEYRPVVQLVNLSTTAAWGVSEPLIPGGGSTANGYPLDQFASEVHELRIFDDAPPYVGRLSVQMVDSATGEPLRLLDGSDRFLLPPLVRVTENGTELQGQLNTRFGDFVDVRCVTVKQDETGLDVEMGWRVRGAPDSDFNIFVHALDAAGQVITQHDGLPLGIDYPPSLWQSGQNLRGLYMLSPNQPVAAIAIGFYRPEGRLIATRDGAVLPNDSLILPLAENSCSP